MLSERMRAEERGREKEGERKRKRERLLLSEFWGNSEKKVVFCSGVTLNKPITLRGALPRVCSRTPSSEAAPPCCARFATSAKSRVALTSEETKEPQRGGRERGRGVNMQRMRGGTAQVGSFTDRWIIIDHTSRVIKSIIEPSCVYFGPCESFKREPQSCAGPKSFSWHDRKKEVITNLPKQWQISPPARWGQAWAPSGAWCDVSFRTGRPRFLCFPSSTLRKKNLHNPPTFFFLNWKIQTPK